jgi:murein L,D-transpeptidase YcbB/YkuD
MRAVLLASTFICAALSGIAQLHAAGLAEQSQPESAVGDQVPQAGSPALPTVDAPVSPPPGSSTGAVPAVSADEMQRREALQKAISERLPRSTDRKDEQIAVESFYKQRGFQPLWTDGGVPTAKALVATDHLSKVGREGLDPADYPYPHLAVFLSADKAADAELKLTLALLTYARHASSGRVSYTRVSGSILYPPSSITPTAALSQIAASSDMAATLTSFEPPHRGYKLLQAQLAKELAAKLAKPDNSDKKRHGKASNADLIIANMERWRWLPRDLGSSYVMVNIPQYALQLMDRGKQVWATKVVVGKPGDMATPLLSETMKYITVNPTWNVPPSIIRNEYLPALERDPGALERIGLKIERKHDGSVRVYQPPGEKNALGRIRFNFPNPFLVYQHDTPNKNLFAMSKRALSHGCMRVQYPEKYAEALLSVSQPGQKVTAERIRGLYGDDERTINLHKPMPVHITYQTASIDEAGKLVKFDDIYGLDATVLKLMRGPERAVADKPIPRNYKSSSQPVMARLPRANATRDNGSVHTSYAADEPRPGFAQPTPATFDRAVGTW